MNTTTTLRASLRPRAISALTVIKPKDNSLEPGVNWRPLITLLTFFVFSSKCWAIVILQVFSMSTFAVLLPVHLETPDQVLGPV